MVSSGNWETRSLSPHLISYDHLDPSPRFTREQVEYIDLIIKDFSGDDLERIRKYEWLQLNLNWELMGQPPKLGWDVIPGLRKSAEQD